MSLSYDWGPWVEHDGKGCLLVVGQYVHLIGLTPITLDTIDQVGVWRGYSCNIHAWHHDRFGKAFDGMIVAKVIRYRIRRPLVRKFLQEITETLPEMEDA